MWKVDGHPRYMNHTQIRSCQPDTVIHILYDISYIYPACRQTIIKVHRFKAIVCTVSQSDPIPPRVPTQQFPS